MLVRISYIWSISAPCEEYRYAVSWGGAVCLSLAGQDLPCLLSIFPDIFVASSCESDSPLAVQRTLATDEPRRMSSPIIPSFSKHSCVHEMIPPGWTEYIHSLHTLVRSETVSVRLGVIFTGYTRTHTHRVRSCVEPRLRGTDTSSSVTAPPWVRNESQQLSTRIWACFKFISKSCFSRAG